MTRETTQQQAASVWAKSDPFVGDVEHWLPLWQHLDDAADVAGMLWDEWLAPSIRSAVAASMPSEGDARRLAVWLAASHDLGKASPAFAVQGRELCADMEHLGLPVGPMVRQDRAKLRHEIASGAILDRWLGRYTSLPPHRRDQLTCIVGGHHGSYPSAVAVSSAPIEQSSLFGTGAWIAVQDLLANRVAARTGITGDWLDWSTLQLPQQVQMILTGLVVMADWIASDSDLFPLYPYGRVPDLPDPVGDTPSARSLAAWSRLAIRAPWQPLAPPTAVGEFFADRFPAAAGPVRPVQEESARLAAELTEPGLIVIEAPMGEGKTEAAMLAAETMAATFGLTGCYWALPTQATSNAMFERMLGWLEQLPDPQGTGSQSVALVHGKAALNETYTGLPFARATGTVRPEDPPDRKTAAVHEWFRGRKRSILADFVTGTIDTVLFAALVSRHMMLRHLGLAGKVVVIDEVHAADVFMSEFLQTALTWLAAEGVPVVLLSATLPPERRVALYRAYAAGRPDGGTSAERSVERELGRRLGYPVLIGTGPDGPAVREVPPSARQSSLIVRRLDDDLADLTTLLATKLANGGCAVVIRNTVRRAQETARGLTNHFGTGQVTLAHAQYLAIDRLARDAELLRMFGPPGAATERPAGPHVVVATQVVEQSLDVDFDLMVTDLAPVDLMLQRTGRLHRHERAGRPIATAECYVTGVDWAVDVPEPLTASALIYGKWPLYRALAVLEDRWDGPLAIPSDIPVLVDRAYSADDAPPGWQDLLAQAWADEEASAAQRRQQAQAFALPAPGRPGRSLYSISRGSVGAVDEDSPKSQGYVRDGGDSVEVVVLQRGADGADCVPAWVDGGGDALPLRSSPVPYQLAKKLARCTLRLPFALSHNGIVDRVIDELETNYFEGWAKSPFLSGQLALVLDEDANAVLAGHRLHYDQQRGLEVERDGT